MGANEQRPRFFEGQFLSAADLEAAVSYQRTLQARHALGAHTWGIAQGLTLRERAAPGAPARVEVILEPGLAWDGFGRALAPDRPVRLSEALFADIAFAAAVDDPAALPTPKGRLVKLWMTYAEVAARPPAPGFMACSDEEQISRVRESFSFLVGEQSGAMAQRAPVSIGTVNVDALEAQQVFDATAPSLWDTSVPHQTFPASAKPPRWLVPLGYVRWVARDGALGYFAKLELDPADNAADRTRSQRRYLGVVAQNIESADGAVVVHRRDETPSQAHSLAKLLASGHQWEALKKDLLWVQGNARVVGDVKLAGGALLLRNGDGLTQNTPMSISRVGDAQPTDGQREMRATIGDTSQINNRFIVGPEIPGASPPVVAPRLVVTSGAGAIKKDAEGRVGINTRDPLAALEVKGDWDGSEDGALRLAGAKPTLRFTGGPDEGSHSWMAQVGDKGQGLFRIAHQGLPGKWDTAISATTAGRVGIGTEAPAGRLTVEGLTQPNQGRLSVFTAGADIEYDGGGDKLFVMRQNPPGETFFDGMKLGVGTVPATQLHVKGARIRLESIDGQRVLDLRSDGSSVDVQSETSHLYLRSTTPAAQGAPARHIVMNSFPEDGRVGVGRTPTTDKLEVQGNVRMGPLANLFAMGANRPLRAVIGNVNADASHPAGLEYQASKLGTGNYRVQLVPPFAAPPVVLVSALNTSNDDNVMTVVNITASSFDVHSRDVVDAAAQAANTPLAQDDPFSFVAFGGV